MTEKEIIDALDKALVNYLKYAISDSNLKDYEAVPAALYLIVKKLEQLS